MHGRTPERGSGTRIYARTKPKHPLVINIRPSADEVPPVRLGKLIVADVHPLHVLFGQTSQHIGHLVCPVIRLQDKRQEHVRSIGRVVPVDKLSHRPRVDDVMQPLKARWKVRVVSASDVVLGNVGGGRKGKLPDMNVRFLEVDALPLPASPQSMAALLSRRGKTAHAEVNLECAGRTFSTCVGVCLEQPPCSFP